MAKEMFEYTPTHPGEVLKDEIESRNITQRQLAEQIDMPYKALNDLLNGRRSLSTTTAMILEAVLDIPAESLMRLQLKYNMHVARLDKSFMDRLNNLRRYAALL